MAVEVIIGVIAYLLGSISFSVIISKKIAGFDVREKGSGNAGTTNVLRSVGKGAAALTLLLDISKGLVAVLIAFIAGKILKPELLFRTPDILVQIAGVCVILGHTFPVFFGFKGGKGIATAIGILLIVNWKIGLICLIFGILIIVLTRMVSAGSVVASILFPVLVLVGGNSFSDSFLVEGKYLIFAIIIACITTFNHRGNIKRILNGTERKLGEKK